MKLNSSFLEKERERERERELPLYQQVIRTARSHDWIRSGGWDRSRLLCTIRQKERERERARERENGRSSARHLNNSPKFYRRRWGLGGRVRLLAKERRGFSIPPPLHPTHAARDTRRKVRQSGDNWESGMVFDVNTLLANLPSALSRIIRVARPADFGNQ